MSNDYFQFQQFRIDQADCAQKVSTDACILGAATDLTHATRILDLGTGTGLLALMVAQRAPKAVHTAAVSLLPILPRRPKPYNRCLIWPHPPPSTRLPNASNGC